MPVPVLTPREREVLILIIKGKTNKEIAKIIQTTERGAKFHVGNLFQKFGVSDRRELQCAACGLFGRQV